MARHASRYHRPRCGGRRAGCAPFARRPRSEADALRISGGSLPYSGTVQSTLDRPEFIPGAAMLPSGLGAADFAPVGGARQRPRGRMILDGGGQRRGTVTKSAGWSGMVGMEWKRGWGTAISTPPKSPLFPLHSTIFSDLRFYSMYRFLTAGCHVPYF